MICMVSDMFTKLAVAFPFRSGIQVFLFGEIFSENHLELAEGPLSPSFTDIAESRCKILLARNLMVS